MTGCLGNNAAGSFQFRSAVLHLFEEVRLSDLAEMAAISKFHLLRAFRDRFGLPPRPAAGSRWGVYRCQYRSMNLQLVQLQQIE